MLKFIKIHILPYIAFPLYKLYAGTIRFIEPELPPEIKKRCVFAHFHQDELCFLDRARKRSSCVMTSTSEDGEMMTNFLKLLGYKCVRGSASKGGTKALLGLIRAVNEKKLGTSLAVDGPRGPIYNVKPGIILLAQKTALPIVPVVAGVSNAFCFKRSWNKALLPKPFSTVRAYFGNVFYVPENISGEEMERLRAGLESDMLRIKDQAVTFTNHKIPKCHT